MKSFPAVVILLLLTPFAKAQNSQAAPSQPQATAAQPPQPATTNLEPILSRIQQVSESTKNDLSALRVDKWKADSAQKAELNKVVDSLRRNLTSAVPDLINDVRKNHGSVSTTFKLYHNLNVVYEYLNYLADSASALGKENESAPLGRDAATLDTARQDLSNFVEQAANNLEEKVRLAAAPPPPAVEPAPKKIVVDDGSSKKPATNRKKKTSPPAPQPVSTPN
jgi:hypothetical protein